MWTTTKPNKMTAGQGHDDLLADGGSVEAGHDSCASSSSRFEEIEAIIDIRSSGEGGDHSRSPGRSRSTGRGCPLEFTAFTTIIAPGCIRFIVKSDSSSIPSGIDGRASPARVDGRPAGTAAPAAARRPARGARERRASSALPAPGRGLDLTARGATCCWSRRPPRARRCCSPLAVLESSMARGPAFAKALLLYPTKALARDQLAGLRELAGGLGRCAARGSRSTTATPRVPAPQDQGRPAGGADHQSGHAAHGDPGPPRGTGRPFSSATCAGSCWTSCTSTGDLRRPRAPHPGPAAAHLRPLRRAPALHCRLGHGRQPVRVREAPWSVAVRGRRPIPGRPSRRALRCCSSTPSASRRTPAAVRVLVEAMRAGLRTIAFTKARRVTELLYTWLVQQEPELAEPCRAVPRRLPARESRRRLESAACSRELSAAILSTSALELGIDVGGLDCASSSATRGR